MEDLKNGKPVDHYATKKSSPKSSSKKKANTFDPAKTYGTWYVKMQEEQRKEEEKKRLKE